MGNKFLVEVKQNPDNLEEALCYNRDGSYSEAMDFEIWRAFLKIDETEGQFECELDPNGDLIIWNRIISH